MIFFFFLPQHNSLTLLSSIPPLQAALRLFLWRWRRATPLASGLSFRHRSPSHTTPPTARYRPRHYASQIWNLNAPLPLTCAPCRVRLQSRVDVLLPDSAAVDPGESSCGTNGSQSWLMAVFGSGHALQFTFASNGSVYSVANLSLQYNLSDSSLFPGSNSPGETKKLLYLFKKSNYFSRDILFIFIIYLKGSVHVDKHVNVNVTQLAKSYFPSTVPGRAEELTIQWQIKMKNTKY